MNGFYKEENSFTKKEDNDKIKLDKLQTVVSNTISNIRKNKENAQKIIRNVISQKGTTANGINVSAWGSIQNKEQQKTLQNDNSKYSPSYENGKLTALPYKPDTKNKKAYVPNDKSKIEKLPLRYDGREERIKTTGIYNTSYESKIKKLDDGFYSIYNNENKKYDIPESKPLNMVDVNEGVKGNYLLSTNINKQEDIKIATAFDDKYKDITINRWLKEGKNKTKEDVTNEIKGSFIYDITTLAQSTNDILKKYLPGLHSFSKAQQRTIWERGSEYYLKPKECYTSAWMLEHSLKDNPEKVIRGDDSRIANLMKNDKNYLTKLDEVLKTKKDGIIDEDLEGVIFSEEDLKLSINKATIHVTGKRESDGTWNLTATVTDTYDFTEILFLESGMSRGEIVGALANNGAYISQIFEAITPYEVEVTFNLRRKPE